ncbi:VWA-like domain-containing protein [uncultured Desulfobacter sp.]|uniref:vWA domain-containing protein n=1 Tax=uncultured Desulfobacter sp. TaxID=240139 RepID=UPI0029F47195|nr:VWA-like domain-containing protein [uncultured Desulfobacter sp.]
MDDKRAKNRLLKARADMVLNHPFFASLAMRLTLKEDRTCRTAWTDGKTFGYNPDYINILPREKLVGLSAHTVMHPACNHHLRRKDKDPKTWNKACDYVINPILLDAGLVLPDGFLWDDTYVGKTAEQVYTRLIEGQGEEEFSDEESNDADPSAQKDNRDEEQKEEEQNSSVTDDPEDSVEKEPDPDESTDPGGTGEVRDGAAPKNKTFSEQDDADMDWDQALIQAASNARSMGKLPKGADILVKERFSPTLPWSSLLSRFIQQSARHDYTWTRPNRRYIHQDLYFPSLVSDQLPQLVVAVDTSGSIKPCELERFGAELQAILSMNPSLIHLVYADMAVTGYEVIYPEEFNLSFKPKGGGGTDFTVVFDFVEKQGIHPFCLLFFTDMECMRFPQFTPAYPVLWIRIGHGGFTPPFGEVIDMLPDDDLETWE